MGMPLIPSPYPPPRFVVGSFVFVGWNWILRHSEKGELGYQLSVISYQLSVISYQLLVFSCQFQPSTPNFQLITDH